MTELIFSLNAVVPLFLVMLLGFILRRRGFIGEDFVAAGTKVCFNVALPCLLFLNIAENEMTETFDPALTLLCVVGTLLFVIALRLIVPRFIKDAYTYSAFIQVTYRTNYVLLGLPFINNVVGPEGIAAAATVLAFMIPTFNVLAVLVLSEARGQGQNWRDLASRIVTNPLIISSLLGISASLLSLPLPTLLLRPVGYLSDMAMPLSLFTIGASLNFHGERGQLRLAAVSSLLKLVVAPLCAVLVGCLLGFNAIQLAVVLAVFAGPPALSCFAMAYQMGADHDLTSLILVFCTAMAAFTMFAFVFVMRLMGLL